MTKIPYENRIGLAVMDAQTFHNCQDGLLEAMKDALPFQIVALGSTNLHGCLGHPFTFEQRIEMIEKVFGQRTFNFVRLKDIDASADNDDWINYVLQKIADIGLPFPTDYFTGSEIDALWYESAFCKISNETLVKPKDLTLRANRNRPLKTHIDPASDKRTHVLSRGESAIPSGRNIRFLIERRDERWRWFVPPDLEQYIEWNYPPHLRQAIVGQTPPGVHDVPIGTRFRSTTAPAGFQIVLELKDDLQWRPNKPDEKAAYADNRNKGD